MQVCITVRARAAMIDAARREHPREACGLLFGHAGTVTHAQPTANVAAEPERHFDIDPAALLAAHRAARANGPELLGYFHSHPIGDAAPSVTDTTMAARDGRIWAIVAGDTMTLWRDALSGFEPLSYDVVDG